MKRADIIAQLHAQNAHLTVIEAQRVVDAIFGMISAAIIAGRRVELRDFGVFTTKARGAREAHNPRSRERIDVEAKRHAFFKAGRGILKRINQTVSEAAEIKRSSKRGIDAEPSAKQKL